MATRPWSNAKLLGALLAGLILLAVVYQGLESLVGSDTTSTTSTFESSDEAAAPTEPAEPIRAEVRRLGDTGVEIDIGERSNTKITVNDAAEADFILACVSDAIKQVDAAHPEGWIVGHGERARVRDEVNRIVRVCLENMNRELRPSPPSELAEPGS